MTKKKPKADHKKQKKHKKLNSLPPLHLPSSSPTLSTLPDEVVVSILSRISKSYYRSLCLVSKSFYSFLSSPEIYTARTEIRATEPRLYLYLRLPKPEKNPWFTLFDKVGDKLGLAPHRAAYSPARLNSTFVAVGSEIYQIGGGKYSKAVCVLDCRSKTWCDAPRLTVGRKNTKSCSLGGNIYVIGGRREDDESMIWGAIFDIKTQIWKPLPSPSPDDNSFQVVVLEGRVNVITKQCKYVYGTEQGRWLRNVLFVDIKFSIGPCCVIDDVMFAEIDGRYKWFDSMNGKWSVLENLDSVYSVWKSCYAHDTIQLVNHGRKLVIIGHYYGKSNVSNIWCAVITQFWGEIMVGEAFGNNTVLG